MLEKDCPVRDMEGKVILRRITLTNTSTSDYTWAIIVHVTNIRARDDVKTDFIASRRRLMS